MASQVLAIIKAVAPYVTQVATVAIPAFTRRPPAERIDPLLAQQIDELQAAVTQNAESLHLLAEQLQQVMRDAERAAEHARRQLVFYKAVVVISALLSLTALGVAAQVLARLP